MKESKVEIKAKNSKKINNYTYKLKENSNMVSIEDYLPYFPHPPIIPNKNGGAMNYSAGGMFL